MPKSLKRQDLEEWKEAQLAEQSDRCAICGRKFNSRLTPRTDHDHRCNCGELRGCEICRRGLLCNKCNLGIGYFNDGIRLLASAIVYLQEWDEKVEVVTIPDPDHDQELPLPGPERNRSCAESTAMKTFTH